MANEFKYQEDGRYFAQCGREIEQLVAEELRELGAEQIEPVHGGVHFQARQEAFYKINYCTRLASRILAPLASFDCRNENDLYRNGQIIRWELLLDPRQTFAVFANVSGSRITHSQYAALKLKDAIADRFRKKIGNRPSVERHDPDLWINLNIQGSHAVISLDTCGGPLHRRGYRVQGGEAPLQETLAAAVIRLSGWDGVQALYDPMCGSGTLVAEALLEYCRIPSQFLRRRFGIERLPDFEPGLWKRVRKTCDSAVRPVPEKLIAGSDIDGKIIKAARANLKRIPSGEKVLLSRIDFRDLASLENRLIVCNLPYGVRLGNKEELKMLYKDFGDFLKKKCRGAAAFLLCGDIEMIGAVGLKPSRRIPLFNGPIECRLLKFEIY